MKLLLVLLLSINLTFASGISPIKKGETASHDGFLITKEFEEDRRKDREELKLVKEKNIVLSDLRAIEGKRVGLYKKDAERYHSELQKEKIGGFLKSSLYFILGIALGTAVTYGIKSLP